VSPDTREHRGPHPSDREFFADEQIPTLRTATTELSWLLSHGYKLTSSMKLVGDRYRLTERQRLAVSRSACSDAALVRRKDHCVSVKHLSNEDVIIDGFNLIISIEAVLSGAPLLVCRDECIRDLSSVHGSYRSVQETESAISLIGEICEQLCPASVLWLLDRPISNSGRLARRIADIAERHGWLWMVEVVFNPDAQIVSSSSIAITSDSSILDRVETWTNLKSYLVQLRLNHSWLIDLRSP
jgi:hypothetical protein